MTKPTGRRGKPLDDFQDDQTGETGDVDATRAAAEAASGGDEDDAGEGDEQGEGEEATSPGKGHNSGKTGLDLNSIAEKCKTHVESWEGQQAEIDAIMDEAKERCQPYKDEQKAIVKAAAEGSTGEAAIPKQVFKTVLILRRNEAKKERTLRKINDDQRDEVMAIAESLPESFIPLPLGQWAMEQAKKKTAAKSSRSARK